MIPASAFDFLKELRANNDRTWFAAHKERYQQEAAGMAAFADALLRDLNRSDVIETPSGAKSLYSIYRDIRFSKDKTPFATYWGGRFKRSGAARRGGYYYHFEPGDKNFILCGFWGPNAADLKLIRDEIAFDPDLFRQTLNGFTFEGEKLKTAPRGYDPQHEALDLLRHKQLLLVRRFTDAEVLSDEFLSLAGNTLIAMRPFLDLMSVALTGQ